MKKILGLIFLYSFVARADVPVPPAATQAEVAAGVLTSKYVSPATAKYGGGTLVWMTPALITVSNVLSYDVGTAPTVTLTGTNIQLIQFGFATNALIQMTNPTTLSPGSLA